MASLLGSLHTGSKFPSWPVRYFGCLQPCRCKRAECSGRGRAPCLRVLYSNSLVGHGGNGSVYQRVCNFQPVNPPGAGAVAVLGA